MHEPVQRAVRTLTLALGLSAIALGQANSVLSVSAADYRPIVAPNSIISGWSASGSGLSAGTVAANTVSVGNQPVSLPTMLGTVSLSVKDSSGATQKPVLYMVSAGQINYVIPLATSLGLSTLTVSSGSNTFTGPLLVSNVAPALFTADASGAGVPVGSVQRVTSAGVSTFDNPFQSGTSTYTPKPINLSSSPSDRVYLILYGTGIRNRSLNPVTATIGDVTVPVQYAGAQSQYPGFDQVNIGPLPQTLVGKGTTNLIITVDGVPSNTVQIATQ